MDLGSMVVKASTELSNAIWPFLWIVGGLCGFWYCSITVMRIIRGVRLPGAPVITVMEAISLFIAASLMANLSVFINKFWNSFKDGETVYGPLSYSGAAELGQLSVVISSVLTMVSLFGGFYFFKGLLLFASANMKGGSGHGSNDEVWRALGHMLWSSALINIISMIESFRQTFGLVW